jgi:peptidoglycan/LPS O-acetylase OafA/YrhL
MKQRFHALDGLRAIAVTLVVIHHLGIGSLSEHLRSAGHTFAGNLIGSITASGVELFFVLSAIVLARPYVRRQRQLVLSTYFSRRLWRLMPPYLAAWVLAGVAIFLATKYPTWWTIKASLAVFSIDSWLEQVVIVYFGPINYNFAWWSLTVEVAFYILLPALIPVFIRLSERELWYTFAFSIILAVLVTPLFGHFPLAHHLSAYASCFCSGLILARLNPSLKVNFALIITGLIWALSACLYDELNIHIGWGAIYFGLVSFAMTPRSLLSKFLSKYELVWLGERSYSLFLVHFSIIGLVCQAMSFLFDSKTLGYFILTRFLSVILSLIAAILVFHFIERRFAHGLLTGNDMLPRADRLLNYNPESSTSISSTNKTALNHVKQIDSTSTVEIQDSVNV